MLYRSIVDRAGQPHHFMGSFIGIAPEIPSLRLDRQDREGIRALQDREGQAAGIMRGRSLVICRPLPGPQNYVKAWPKSTLSIAQKANICN